MKAKRINEFDVIITGTNAAFIKALRAGGLKAWKLDEKAYQVSFAGRPELRAELPPVGTEYRI